MNDKSLTNRINDGEFNNSVPYPDNELKIVSPKLYKDAVQKYREGEGAAIDRFREAMEKEYGLTPDHPLSSPLFSAAWEEGHSGGFSEVWNSYQDLAENFLKPFNDLYKKAKKAGIV